MRDRKTENSVRNSRTGEHSGAIVHRERRVSAWSSFARSLALSLGYLAHLAGEPLAAAAARRTSSVQRSLRSPSLPHIA
jgi:hypothetical protein